jgi:hypothetical protein
MTLGASGGQVKPLTRDELIELARATPVTDLVTCGRAFGVSEPVIREMARNGALEKMGVRVLRLGAQYRIPVADILAVLGMPPVPLDAAAAPRLVHGGANAVQERCTTPADLELRRPA